MLNLKSAVRGFLFSQMTSKIREYCSFIGGETVAETRPFFAMFYTRNKP